MDDFPQIYLNYSLITNILVVFLKPCNKCDVLFSKSKYSQTLLFFRHMAFVVSSKFFPEEGREG